MAWPFGAGGLTMKRSWLIGAGLYFAFASVSAMPLAWRGAGDDDDDDDEARAFCRDATFRNRISTIFYAISHEFR
jgi:hypothetical protein